MTAPPAPDAALDRIAECRRLFALARGEDDDAREAWDTAMDALTGEQQRHFEAAVDCLSAP